jgi:ABC-2 type transport system ATP-binding protein
VASAKRLEEELMIETRGLTKRYGPTLAVDDLSFTIQPGQVTGFLGPNGSGKSTTMRMILGLDRPTSGQALINGRPYRELDHPLRTVGALLDAKWVHPNRSARSHLRWLARSNRLLPGRVDEVLDQVGLTAVADRRAGAFSLGMSQRLGIAAALLGDPEILLFDEPVNGLDPEGIVWIRQFMRHLASEGRSVLVSSHLLPEMALTATELVVIGRGRLIAQSSTTEFVDGAARSTVRVRSPQLLELAEILMRQGIDVKAAPDGEQSLVVSGADTARVGELAAGAGVVLHELALHRGSLEEAFMHITGHDVEYTAGGSAGDRNGSAALTGAGR